MSLIIKDSSAINTIFIILWILLSHNQPLDETMCKISIYKADEWFSFSKLTIIAIGCFSMHWPAKNID